MESELLHDRTSDDSIQSNSVMAQYDYGQLITGQSATPSGGSPTRLDRLDYQLITNFHNDSQQFQLSTAIQEEAFGNGGQESASRHLPDSIY